MGKRNTGRKLAMKILYQADLRRQNVADVLPDFFDESDYTPATREWAQKLAEGAWLFREKADAIIQSYSIGWDLTRMTPIDLSLLRLALYELNYEDTPLRVILDEVIEIAKKYSTEDSPKFINGILGAYVDSLKKEQGKEQAECLPESSKQ